MFGFNTNEGVKTVSDRHFANIFIEIWVQPLNVYDFFHLLSALRGILVNYAKVIDGGQGVVKICTMFEYGRGAGLGVFLDPLPEGP